MCNRWRFPAQSADADRGVPVPARLRRASARAVHACRQSSLLALAIHADAADTAAVKASVAQTVETWGRLDILVNNAGIIIVKPIDDITLEDFDRMVAVNIKGLFGANTPRKRVRLTRGLGTRAANRAMKSSRSKMTCVVPCPKHSLRSRGKLSRHGVFRWQRTLDSIL